VSGNSSGVDVTRIITVRAGGSSIVFNSAFADSARLPPSRSASNNTTTLRGPSIGLRDASGMMRWRTSSFTR
jgi:hypothetical protein